MNRESLVFCLLAVAVTLAVSALGFRVAALPAPATPDGRAPVAAETLPDVDLGGAWGKVSVIELLGFYIENPPAPANAAGGSVPATRRFGGC